MIYGLLHINIREVIEREDIANFDRLNTKARRIEKIFKEKQNTTENIVKLPKRCNFCNMKGHTIDECRKKQALENKDSTKVETLPECNTVSCYGCGTSGVFRSNCPRCNPQKSTSSGKQLQFHYASITLVTHNVPIVNVYINGINGTAYLDTCARTNVATTTLYHILRK